MVLALFLLLLPLVLRGDSLHLSPATEAASPHLFSLETWITRNLFSKWWREFRHLLTGQGLSEEERLARTEEFFRLRTQVQELQRELARQAAQRAEGQTASPGPTEGEGPIEALEAQIQELVSRRNKLRNDVESTLEGKLASVLKEQELRRGAGPFKLLWPPVDFRFDRLPRLLIISPRDRIHLEETKLLHSNISLEKTEQLEKKLRGEENLSALVGSISGLAAYPAIIRDTDPLRDVLQTAAHEWLHQYWFFHSLGQAYFSSPEMTTLNETAADIAGRELGNLAFDRLSISAPPPSSPVRDPARDGFDFDREMRETRLMADSLLAEGKIEEAEAYMEERRGLFVAHGYSIRKLNQAYFAFHGTYAESPASVSPIAGQLHQLRGQSADVSDFVQTVSGFGSYQEFLDYLEEFTAAQRGVAHGVSG